MSKLMIEEIKTNIEAAKNGSFFEKANHAEKAVNLLIELVMQQSRAIEQLQSHSTEYRQDIHAINKDINELFDKVGKDA